MLAKLGKASQDAYNPGGWLILWALLKNGVAEGVASDPRDPTSHTYAIKFEKKMTYLELAYLEFAYSMITFYSNMYLYIYNFSKQQCIQTGSKYK